MVCYDALPSLNLSQIQKMADWYQKAQRFQRAVYSGDGKLEEKVNAYFNELAKPYEFVQSGAAIDTDVANEPQFTNVPERLGLKEAA
jgi:lysozyme family protein